MRLRRLSDNEYAEVESKARMTGFSLDQCPTCKNRGEEVESGIRIWNIKTFLYRGERQVCDCQAQMALRRHYLLAGIGDQYMRLDWADYDGSEEVRDSVERYLTHWEAFKDQGMGLEFGGPLGSGKTMAATYIGKELIKLGQKVFFVPFVEMISTFEKSNGEELERRMRETTYLILDEVLPPFSERSQQFYAARFEALMRHRTNYNLPTIITTNLDSDAMHLHYPRIYSLLEAKQIRIEVPGEDARRGKIAQENLALVLAGEVKPLT